VVSLDFSMTYSLRPYHVPGVDSATSENENQENFLGLKAAGVWGWQPHHLHMPNIMEIWEPKPPVTLWTTPGLLREFFTFTFLHIKNCWLFPSMCFFHRHWMAPLTRIMLHIIWNWLAESLCWLRQLAREQSLRHLSSVKPGHSLSYNWLSATGRRDNWCVRCKNVIVPIQEFVSKYQKWFLETCFKNAHTN